MKSAIAFLVLMIPATANAQGIVGKAARETAEFLMGKFGRQVATEGAEKLAGRIATAAARHGDEVVTAVRRAGPQALKLVDDAGANAPQVIRLLSRYGDDAARLLSQPKAAFLVSRFGDDAAAVILKHEGIAEPLVEKFGSSAVSALGKVGARGGQRLAIMGEAGEIGPEMMGVIAKYGDPAMEFIWRHKAALAATGAMAAFVNNPKPFIDGTNQLATTVGENVAKPTLQAAGKVAQEAATFVRWALTIGVGTIAVGACMALRHRVLSRAVLKLAGRLIK